MVAARQERPSAPSIAIGNEEGVRVTADIQEDVAAAAPAQQPRLKPLDADGLRSAVLWGENSTAKILTNNTSKSKNLYQQNGIQYTYGSRSR